MLAMINLPEETEGPTLLALRSRVYRKESPAKQRCAMSGYTNLRMRQLAFWYQLLTAVSYSC